MFDDTLEKLKTYFSTRKIIEVKFSEKVVQSALDKFNVVAADAHSANIEVDVSKLDLKREVSRIFSELPVNDININNIAIEEVIKHIYRRDTA